MSSLIANDSDYSAEHSGVAVLFADPEIAHLFSSLLEVHGARPHVLSGFETLPKGMKLVTEPQFLSRLEQESQIECLIVGNGPQPSNSNMIYLSRPLTEAKITAALESFLGPIKAS